MAKQDENSRGLRSQWAASTPTAKLLTVLAILATVAIVVFFILPLIRSIFNAGQGAVR
jgi:hypothetical protein